MSKVVLRPNQPEGLPKLWEATIAGFEEHLIAIGATPVDAAQSLVADVECSARALLSVTESTLDLTPLIQDFSRRADAAARAIDS